MQCTCRGWINVGFKLSCFITVTVMIGVWFYKFDNDKDVCTIDYEPFENLEHAEIPQPALCFLNPILKEKLNEIVSDVNASDYIRYLIGEYFDERFKNIDYDNVTLNLADYTTSILVGWRNRSESFEKMYVTYTFTWNHLVCKCFVINTKLYLKNVRYILQTYNVSLFKQWFKTRDISPMIMFNLPNQYSLVENWNDLVTSESGSNGITMQLGISEIEILKRRNKRKAPCTKEWWNFDELSLKRHIENAGCRAPYHAQYKQSGMCSTQNEMKVSYFDLLADKYRYQYEPCQVMSRIDISYKAYKPTGPLTQKDQFRIDIWYSAERVKVITQTQAVDEHALIGNIGGYIGLFLGMSHCYISKPACKLYCRKY